MFAGLVVGLEQVEEFPLFAGLVVGLEQVEECPLFAGAVLIERDQQLLLAGVECCQLLGDQKQAGAEQVGMVEVD